MPAIPYPTFAHSPPRACDMSDRAALLGGGAAVAMTAGAGHLEAAEGARLVMDLAEGSAIAGMGYLKPSPPVWTFHPVDTRHLS